MSTDAVPLGGLPGLVPHWSPAPCVRAFQTVRAGGVSAGPFGLADGSAGGLNLGEHVGDDPGAVRENRSRLGAVLPAPVRWLQQVHGTGVHVAEARAAGDAPMPRADAAIVSHPGAVIAVMTADCLPVLLADRNGRVAGVAHAGWRGLAGGVLEATVREMRTRAGADVSLVAWLGPAIGPDAFEVGDEVRQAFRDADARAATCFVPGARAGKWLADLYALARLRLAAVGVDDVAGGGLCTVRDASRFYSHRRDGRSGRMASLVWLVG